MTQHIVIRKDNGFMGTKERLAIQVFTQTHKRHRPRPWGRLAKKDVVWMKLSGGPIVARAVVIDYHQIEDCTVEKLRNLVKGTHLFDDMSYWENLPQSFLGMAIFIGSESYLDNYIHPEVRSYGGSWIILDSDEKEKAWLTDNKQGKSKQSTKSRSRRRSPTPSMRFDVLRRDNFTCVYCGRKSPKVELQVDHIIPFSKGGLTELSNLRTACFECNIGKSNKLLQE